MNYEKKYLKYKNKYLQLLEKKRGGGIKIMKSITGDTIPLSVDQNFQELRLRDLINIIRNELRNPYIYKLIIGHNMWDSGANNEDNITLSDFINTNGSDGVPRTEDGSFIIQVHQPGLSEVIISTINKASPFYNFPYDEIINARSYITGSDKYSVIRLTDEDIESIYKCMFSSRMNSDDRPKRYELFIIYLLLMKDFVEGTLTIKSRNALVYLNKMRPLVNWTEIDEYIYIES